MYPRCNNEDKFKNNISWKFDAKNDNFNQYKGNEHSHEAAFDAHMTGVIFMHVLKLKEISNQATSGLKKDHLKEKMLSLS